MKELDGETGTGAGAGSVAGGSSVKGSDDGSDAVLVDSGSVPGSAKKKKGGRK